MTTERRFANLDDATAARIHDVLLEAIGAALKDRVQVLLDHGLTDEEVNAHLKVCTPRVNQWRIETLGLIERALNDPLAPSWRMH